MAAGQRVPVSVFFLCTQTARGASDRPFQRAVAKPVVQVRCYLACFLMLLFILHHGLQRRPKLLERTILTRLPPVVDKTMHMQRKQALYVFLVAMVPRRNTHH